MGGGGGGGEVHYHHTVYQTPPAVVKELETKTVQIKTHEQVEKKGWTQIHIEQILRTC